MKPGMLAAVATALALAGFAPAQDVSLLEPATESAPQAAFPASLDPGPGGPPPTVYPAPGISCVQDYPREKVWVAGEYLFWWVKNGPLPVPLITTGPITDALPGTLGQPNTSVVIGNTEFDYKTFSGARVTAGFSIDPEQMFGIEASGFLLERRPAGFSAASNGAGNPALVLPVFNTATGTQNRFTIAESDLRSGNVAATSDSRLWGAEANGLLAVFRTGEVHTTLLAGFRYADLQESLDITQNSTALPGGSVMFLGVPLPPPASLRVIDTFQTRNQFYGGQLGARAEYEIGRVYGTLSVKVAAGETHESIETVGTTALLFAGMVPIIVPGGRLAGPSNSGRFAHDHFSVLPEAEGRIGMQVTGFLKAFVGYDFLYWTDVVRPGGQIDQRVDKRQVPTSESFTAGFVGTSPALPFRRSDFWAQGVNFGLEFSY